MQSAALSKSLRSIKQTQNNSNATCFATRSGLGSKRSLNNHERQAGLRPRYLLSSWNCPARRIISHDVVNQMINNSRVCDEASFALCQSTLEHSLLSFFLFLSSSFHLRCGLNAKRCFSSETLKILKRRFNRSESA
jgi:hypothetical protein